MLRRLAMSLVVLCLFTARVEAQNALANPGFQSNFAGWIEVTGVPTWMPEDASGSPSSGSARLRLTNRGNFVQVGLYQQAKVPPNRTYGYGARVRMPSVCTGCYATISTYYFDGMWRLWNVTFITTPTNGFQQFFRELPPPTPGITDVEINLGLYVPVGAGTLVADFDDVFFGVGTPPAPQPACPQMTDINWFVSYDDPALTCSPFKSAACPGGVPLTFRAQHFGYPLECAPHTFSWNFGDGTTGTGQTVTKTFGGPGAYNVAVTINNGSQTFVTRAIVTVAPAARQPSILSFRATPPKISAGQQAVLSFETADAAAVVIDGVGAQPLSGSVVVTPSSTTTYTLRAMSGSLVSTDTVTVEVTAEPAVSVSAFPTGMVQEEGRGGATTSYALTNGGGASTSIVLAQNGGFFTQSPASFTLERGATQVVTITAAAQPAGDFLGVSIPSGAGVPAGLQIPVRLLSSAPPRGPVKPKFGDNRLDTSAPANVNPTGTARITNDGTATLVGSVTADVPWITPSSSVITVAPGASADIGFTIDRSRRNDADALLGSASGNLSVSYLSGSGAGKGVPGGDQSGSGSSINVTKVTVVDTVRPPTGTGAPPPLAANEVALFLAGLGHVQSSVGLFISDVSIVNPANRAINDIRFFYTPTTASALSESRTADVPLASSRSVTLGDVVKTTFGQDTQGTLQIRSSDAARLAVNASVFNTSNAAGTYGTAIPIIRSDHAAGPGESIVLTGLRRDASSYTNLYIQEVNGQPVTVQTEFFAADGSSLGTRSDDVGAFGLKQIGRAVPERGVSAVLSTAAGRFQAFATPVDTTSGDTWSVADWGRLLAYPPNAVTVIPVAGVLAGAGNTFFQTDLAFTNRGMTQATAELRFVGRSGENLPRSISLGPRQTIVVSNAVGDFFGAANGSVGFIAFVPITGEIAATSRTYTTVAGQSATYGTGVPVVANSTAMRRGAVRVIAGLSDSAIATVMAQRPATFRTNFGMMETSLGNVTVRVTLRFTYAAGNKVSGAASASRDYQLGPNKFVFVNGLTADVLGASRASLGDLSDVEATFQVIDGDGSVIVFTSSVDNGTGDTILRLE